MILIALTTHPRVFIKHLMLTSIKALIIKMCVEIVHSLRCPRMLASAGTQIILLFP